MRAVRRKGQDCEGSVVLEQRGGWHAAESIGDP